VFLSLEFRSFSILLPVAEIVFTSQSDEPAKPAGLEASSDPLDQQILDSHCSAWTNVIFPEQEQALLNY